MADVSGLILTVLGLSFNLASIFFSYAKDVRSARGMFSKLVTGFLLWLLFCSTWRCSRNSIRSRYQPNTSLPKIRINSLFQRFYIILARPTAEIDDSKESIPGEISKDEVTISNQWDPTASSATRKSQDVLYASIDVWRDVCYDLPAISMFSLTSWSDVTHQNASQISDLRSLILKSSQERQMKDPPTFSLVNRGLSDPIANPAMNLCLELSLFFPKICPGSLLYFEPIVSFDLTTFLSISLHWSGST